MITKKLLRSSSGRAENVPTGWMTAGFHRKQSLKHREHLVLRKNSKATAYNAKKKGKEKA